MQPRTKRAMKPSNYAFIILCCFLSCDQVKEFYGNKPAEGKDPSVARLYHANGKLKFECGIDSLKKRHGHSRSYRVNGVIEKEFTYVHGVKTKGIVYYENGNPQIEINYKDGKKDGIRKKYYKTGQLESELEYKENMAAKGLKEFSKNGKLRTSYPDLIINPVDKIRSTGQYILEVSFSKYPARGKYYLGSLKDGKFLSRSLVKLKKQNGKGIFIYEVPPGMFIMEKVTFVGEYKTPMNNAYIVEKTFNVAIDNPL